MLPQVTLFWDLPIDCRYIHFAKAIVPFSLYILILQCKCSVIRSRASQKKIPSPLKKAVGSVDWEGTVREDYMNLRAYRRPGGSPSVLVSNGQPHCILYPCVCHSFIHGNKIFLSGGTYLSLSRDREKKHY